MIRVQAQVGIFFCFSESDLETDKDWQKVTEVTLSIEKTLG